MVITGPVLLTNMVPVVLRGTCSVHLVLRNMERRLLLLSSISELPVVLRFWSDDPKAQWASACGGVHAANNEMRWTRGGMSRPCLGWWPWLIDEVSTLGG